MDVVGHYPVEVHRLARALREVGVDVMVQPSGDWSLGSAPKVSVGSGLPSPFLSTFRALHSARRSIGRQTFVTCVSGDVLAFSLYALTARRFFGAIILRDWGRTSRPRRLRARIRRLLENFATAVVARSGRVSFMAISQELAEAYKITGFGGDVAEVPPVAVDRQDVSEADGGAVGNHRPTQVLIFGVGHGGKDYETAIRGVAACERPIHLVLAGKVVVAENDPFVLRARYKIASRVTVHDGFLESSTIKRLFSECDFVLMSYRPGFVLESGVLRDAVSFQKPIVASDVGAIGRTVKEWGLGLVYPAGDVVALASALTSAIDSGLGHDSTVLAALDRYAAAHTWDAIARRHLDVYGHLMAACSGAGATPVHR